MFNEITLLLFCIEIYHPWLNIDLVCGSLQSPVSIFQGQIKEIVLHLLTKLWLQQQKEKRGFAGIYHLTSYLVVVFFL